MTKREIHEAIFVTGIGRGNYEVINRMPGQWMLCHVETVAMGNAIVRALRALALAQRGG